MPRFMFPSLETLKPAKFIDLEGKIIIDIRRLWHGSNEVIFVCSDGHEYMLHPAEDSDDIPYVATIIGSIGDFLDRTVIWVKDGKDDKIYPNKFIIDTTVESLSITFTPGELDFIRIK